MSFESIAGYATPLIVYAGVTLLHRVLPAKIVSGYVQNPASQLPYRYRINGMRVLWATMGIWVLACASNLLAWDWFYQQRWRALTSSCVIGLAYTVFVVLREPATNRGLWIDLFLGRAHNLQYPGHVDAKMLLYLLGAVMLVLNTLSFTAFHVITFGTAANPGVYLFSALFCFFVLDYLYFEQVHLYTYDLFAERVGFKLGWGCLVFYPYFYPIGLWGTAHLATPVVIDNQPIAWLVGSSVVFFSGWLIARGANLQKYYFKIDSQRVFLRRIEPVTLSGGNQQLLCSGFWGAARHINYLGEILMALGLALALGHLSSPWPWLYPLYYVALLFPRERDDDARCAEKYGPLWQQYQQRVPYRIIPYVY